MMKLMLGDCLDRMAEITSGSVDMVFADLPYGTTYAKWDNVIDMHVLWDEYRRVLKKGGALVLTATQPFTSRLVSHDPESFRCEWVWDKVYAANFANAKRQPMKVHESVLVFSFGQSPRYFPIKTVGRRNHVQGSSTVNASDTRLIKGRSPDDLSGLKYPKTIQTFPKHSSQVGLHPTQKPVPLVEYFIETYSREGEVVLDNTMGSGTTGVACAKTFRDFVGIESDRQYFEISYNRIADAVGGLEGSLLRLGSELEMWRD